MLAKGKIAYKLGIFDNSIQGATGLPNSKLNISANKDGFHYADKVWYPTSSENAIIICLKDKILGYNVKFENEKAKILEIVIFGHLHSGPSETSLVIGKVVVGTKVTQIDFSDDWYKVQLSNKQSGWIYKSLVKIEK